MTDDELVQMVLESEVQSPENDFPDLWGSGFPVPQEVAYVDAIIGE
jgi:hypothetical protein